MILYDGVGETVASERLAIPCGGSRLFRYHDLFDAKIRAKAGENAHILVRDATCRLFGYQGLVAGEDAFSFDHMFGF